MATVFAVFVRRELNMPAWALGVVLGFCGLGGFIGAVLSTRIGARVGAGNAILLGRALIAIPWALLAFLPLGRDTNSIFLISLVALAQFLYGFAMGIEDANEIAYRQAVAPDEIQGRMNATIRTTNRIIFFFGALGAGVLATWLGYHFCLGLAAVIFLAAALVVAFSPLRRARHDDVEPATAGHG